MRLLLSGSILLVFGCGTTGTGPGSEAGPLPPMEPMDGPSTEPAAGPTESPDPTPAGPVSVTVTTTVANEEATAEVRLIDAQGETVADGISGQSFTVPAGTYTVSAQITDTSVLIDQPTIREEATLTPGEPQTVALRFPSARVRLHIRRRGRALRNPTVRLFRQGGEEPVAEFRAASEITVSPGRYEAVVVTSREETRVRGLTFMDGAQQNIPVQIN